MDMDVFKPSYEPTEEPEEPPIIRKRKKTQPPPPEEPQETREKILPEPSKPKQKPPPSPEQPVPLEEVRPIEEPQPRPSQEEQYKVIVEPNYSIDDERRSTISKIKFIIVSSIIVGVCFWYYFGFIAGTIITVKGDGEKLTIKAPAKYVVVNLKDVDQSKKYYQNDTFITYDPDQKFKDLEPSQIDVENFNNLKTIMVYLYGKNTTGNASKHVDKFRQALEKTRMTSDELSTIEVVKIKNYQAIKYSGNIKQKYDIGNYTTQYFIITDKNIYLIGRYNPDYDKNYAEKEFKRMLNSINISKD